MCQVHVNATRPVSYEFVVLVRTEAMRGKHATHVKYAMHVKHVAYIGGAISPPFCRHVRLL